MSARFPIFRPELASETRTAPAQTRRFAPSSRDSVCGGRFFVSAGFLVAFLAITACGSTETEEPATPVEAPEPVAAQPAEAPEVEPEPEPEPEDEGPPKRIFARRFVVPVRAEPNREADRIGYLRAGAVLEATTSRPVSEEGCREGWYELTTGGFVCNGRHVIAFDGRRLPERRSRQPDREAPLPYEYGFVRRPVPMYRRPPTDEEAAEHEGYRIPGAEPPEGSEATAEGNEGTTGLETSMATAMEAPSMAPTMEAPSMSPAEMTAAIAEAGQPDVPEEEAPPTLATLEGDRNSVVMRRMMRGFYVSLDRDMRRAARRYWRTQNNGFVPYTAVMRRTGSEYRGIELNEEVTLPFAFAMARRSRAYSRAENGRFRPARGGLPQREGFPVFEEVEDNRGTWIRGPEDRWYRGRDVRVIRREPMRPEMQPGDKWFDINLERQVVVAYEGERPVYIALMSSGLPNRTNLPERDFETLTGLFRVKSKHLTDTMDGDTAVDGPYSVDDVPYVMYFELAYALHSAFWHGRFGYPKSHGCVNLSPQDARYLFNWADPPLPDGWHSAYPTEEVPGTWVWVHGDTYGRR